MYKFLPLLLIFVVFSATSFGQAVQDQKVPSEQVEAQPVAIPVTLITEKADVVQQGLQKILQDLESSEVFAEFEENIPQVLDSLKKLQSNKILSDITNLELRVLNALHQEWKLYQSRIDEWKERLLTESQSVEKKLLTIKEIKVVWQLTGEEAQKEKAPQAIQKRVSTILKEIVEGEKKVNKRLNELLIFQNTISKSQNEIIEIVKKIAESEDNLRGQIFVRDSPPLLEFIQTHQDTLHLAEQFQESWEQLVRSNYAFIQANTDRFYIHVVLFVILLVLMLYISHLNKKKQLFDEEDSSLKDSAYFISRPFSASLLIALFLSVWIYPDFPAAVGEFLLLLLLLPVLRLVRGMLPGELLRPFYIMAGVFVLDILQKNALGFVLMQRMILLFATLTILIVLLWLMRPRSPIHNRKLIGAKKLLFRSAYVVIVFLIISFLANLYGSVSLAKTLTWGVIESTHLLVTIYITVTVSLGLVTVLIRRRRARSYAIC